MISSARPLTYLSLSCLRRVLVLQNIVLYWSESPASLAAQLFYSLQCPKRQLTHRPWTLNLSLVILRVSCSQRSHNTPGPTRVLSTSNWFRTATSYSWTHMVSVSQDETTEGTILIFSWTRCIFWVFQQQSCWWSQWNVRASEIMWVSHDLTSSALRLPRIR